MSQSSKRTAKRLMKKYSLVVLKEYHASKITRIRLINQDLDKLANGGLRGLRTADHRSLTNSQLTAAAQHCKRVRNHAALLYGVLKENLQAPHCQCHLPHNVNLQLEIRSITAARESNGLRFKFVFSFNPGSENLPPWNWRELELEHFESDESNHDMQSDKANVDFNDQRLQADSDVLQEPDSPAGSKNSTINRITKRLLNVSLTGET
jgi:hypothetical protein